MHTLACVDLLQKVADPLACLDLVGVVRSIHFFLLQGTHQTLAKTLLGRTSDVGQTDLRLLLLELVHIPAGQIQNAVIAVMDRRRANAQL